MANSSLKLSVCTILLFIIAVTSVELLQQPYATVTAATTLTQLSTSVSAATGNFSIVWITDTQYLSESYPSYFTALCRWIVNNAEEYNVKMVIHTGDIVNVEGNRTQWENANTSMSTLINAGIPYCWDAGNHDFNSTCWIGDQYAAFNGTAMSAKSYWLGSYDNSMDTAVHFNVSSLNFLIVNLAFQANDSDLAWANSILSAYPDSHAIVATHAYLNPSGQYSSWSNHFREQVLATHPNVFLTLNGHYYPTDGVMKTVGGRTELLFNRQDQDGEMGAATIRILNFDTDKNTISVKTFVLYANTFLTNANNQFTFNTAFYNSNPQDASIPEFPSAIAIAFGLVSVVSSAFFLRKRKTRCNFSA